MRYMGNKHRTAKYIIPIMLRNRKESQYYIEPFIGGGNVIDKVTYNDALPWPEEADGAGSFLKLVSLNLDNSLASSWVAQDDTTDNLSLESVQTTAFVTLYPNPVSNVLQIQATSSKILSVKILNLNGKLYSTNSFNSWQVELDLSAYDSGFYIVQIKTDRELLHKKIIKN